MGIAFDTAKSHVSEIISKLQVSSREEAAAWQPEPPEAPVLRPSWANALGGLWPLIPRIAGAGAVAAAVAGIALLAYGVMQSEGREEPSGAAAPSAAAGLNPGPPSEAQQIVAVGTLRSFASTESGTVLSVWGTCESFDDSDCGYAWRLGTGSPSQATGVVGGSDINGVDASASEAGFVLTHVIPHDRGLLIAPDGTTSSLSLTGYCSDAPQSADTEPGRLVKVAGQFRSYVVDTAARTFCDTNTGFGGRPTARSVFVADGTLWALVNNEIVGEPDPDTMTIAHYDGSQWSYRDLAAKGGRAWSSLLAAAGSNVVVFQVEDSSLIGTSVTVDSGANWHEVTDQNMLVREVPFAKFLSPNLDDAAGPYASMAFAGTSTLYVADLRGDLWRSTDFATFSRVEIAGDVADLKPAGDAVIGRLDGNELIRISADGSVEPIRAR
jgi:hypothetical protein